METLVPFVTSFQRVIFDIQFLNRFSNGNYKRKEFFDQKVTSSLHKEFSKLLAAFTENVEEVAVYH